MSRTPFFRTKGKGCVFFILPQCSLGLLTPFGQKVGFVNLTKWYVEIVANNCARLFLPFVPLKIFPAKIGCVVDIICQWNYVI